jgi:tetratricopeptide (TPR) repeat protein
VLHDLRNDWIDNLYLIWGAAYYLRKDFDSAFLMFQFINYAFAPKEKDGYYRYIGSRMDGNTATSIVTKEKSSLTKKIFSEPPSRNDAFIWQIRTLLAKEDFTGAASMIEALKNDPNFPARLYNDLEEVEALYFYKQDNWDSSATHLSNALDNALDKNERTRWEYLIAQLYEKAGKYNDAVAWYDKVINHANDPVLEIYARLNAIRINQTGGENYIDNNIAELMKMARKDKYADYRDMIYFMAAQMEMERNNTDAAVTLLLKSTFYNSGNYALRNKAYLQLGEIALSKRKYRQAHNYYDSLQMSDPSLPEPDKIVKEKELLDNIAANIETIQRQDSLQHLAALPEEERKNHVKKLVKQLRRAHGLKEEYTSAGQALTSGFQNKTNADIFSNNPGKGEWYFYNTTLRKQGYDDFKSKWGNRPDVDNWRRINAVNSPGGNDLNAAVSSGTQVSQAGASGDITFDALYNRIPLTADKMKASNDSIQTAMFNLGKLYVDELGDCAPTVSTFEELRERFPAFDKMDEVLFHLYHCYSKDGPATKAEEIKKLMSETFAKSKFTKLVITGKELSPSKPDPAATRIYEDIYEQFIEGKFEEATAEKKVADSLYGTNYWSPQLLYIEAVYHVKLRDDSTAIKVLNQIKTKYPGNALAQKADNLINVLNRRSAIEEELRNLKIDTTEEVAVKPAPEIKTYAPRKDTSAAHKVFGQPKTEPVTVIKSSVDSLKKIPPPPPITQFIYKPGDKHYVVVILNKVDNVFRNEAKNAFLRYNQEKYYNRSFDYSTFDIDAENKLLLIGLFDDEAAAITYIQKSKPVATTEIIPWLKPEKYSFSIISSGNLELLKVNPKLSEYKKFADQHWQGKF